MPISCFFVIKKKLAEKRLLISEIVSMIKNCFCLLYLFLQLKDAKSLFYRQKAYQSKLYSYLAIKRNIYFVVSLSFLTYDAVSERFSKKYSTYNVMF